MKKLIVVFGLLALILILSGCTSESSCPPDMKVVREDRIRCYIEPTCLGNIMADIFKDINQAAICRIEEVSCPTACIEAIK